MDIDEVIALPNNINTIKEEFIDACKSNNKIQAIEIYQKSIYLKIELDYKEAFIQSYKSNSFDVVKWLAETYEYKPNYYTGGFVTSCMSKYYIMARWFISKIDHKIFVDFANYSKLNRYFNEICCNDQNLEIVKLIKEHCHIPLNIYICALEEAISNGCIQIIQWLLNLEKKSKYHNLIGKYFSSKYILDYNAQDYRNLMLYACLHNHLDIAKFFYAKMKQYEETYEQNNKSHNKPHNKQNNKQPKSQTRKQIVDEVFGNTMELNTFETCCKNGYLDIIKWLYTILDKDIIHKNIYDLFFSTCSNGKYELAQWLYTIIVEIKDIITISVTELSKNVNKSFMSIIAHGHFELAQWLYSLELDTIKFKNIVDLKNAFILSCLTGHLNLAKWIYDINNNQFDPIQTIHEINEYLFREACKNADLDMAKWLYTLCETNNSKINIRVDDDYAIRSCEDYDTILWLISLEPKYRIRSMSDFMVGYYIMSDNQYNLDCAIKENKLDEYFANAEKIAIDNVCPMCLNDEQNKMVRMSCKHFICVDCYLEKDTCPFGCKINNAIDLFINE